MRFAILHTVIIIPPILIFLLIRRLLQPYGQHIISLTYSLIWADKSFMRGDNLN
jgi:hypothetical protein